MKIFSWIFLVLMFSSGVKAQLDYSNSLIYPELDKQLLSLWLSAQKEDATKVDAAIKAIKMEWREISSNLGSIEIEHINMEDFVSRVNGYVLSLDPCKKRSDYSCLVSVSYHLLYEFRSLRQCLFKTEYPLDILWESMDSYKGVRKTINDRMFDLKEWFEFEDQVNDFKCKWEYYDLRHIDQIHENFPGVNKAIHRDLKDNVNGCIRDLLDSIETGYQDNFVLPCDELGQALKDLLQMYAESKAVMLM